MLLKRHFERLLLRPADLKPSRDDFEVVGVFNPGAIVAEGEVILLVRVAERPRERRGVHGAAALGSGRGPGDRLAPRRRARAARSARRQAQGRRPGAADFHLAPACRAVRRWPVGTGSDQRPFLARERLWKNSGSRTRGSRRSTTGFTSLTSPCRDMARRRRWPRRPTSATSIGTGCIFCPENKDVVLFPERIDGQYVALHRPNAATPFCRPEMWVARSPDLIHWGRARVPARRRGRVGDRPRRRGHAAGACRGRMARDLPRQPPADPARRGGNVFDRRVAARSEQPGEGPSAHGGFDLRADGRFRAARLRAGRGFSDRDRRDGRFVSDLLWSGRFVHGGG